LNKAHEVVLFIGDIGDISDTRVGHDVSKIAVLRGMDLLSSFYGEFPAEEENYDEQYCCVISTSPLVNDALRILVNKLYKEWVGTTPKLKFERHLLNHLGGFITDLGIGRYLSETDNSFISFDDNISGLLLADVFAFKVSTNQLM
jgi:hypothetical protein